MKFLIYTSATILCGFAANPSNAQNIVVFDETGVIVDGIVETDILTVELPATAWITTEAAAEDKSWVFTEAKEPEIKWADVPAPEPVTMEAEEAELAIAEAETRVAEAEAPVPRIEVAVTQPTVARAEPPKMEDLIDQGKVLRLYAIQFDYDKATLRPEAMPTITQIAEALKRAPSISIVIEGHTDARGSRDYNQDLSRRRAISVANALVEIHGIDRSRLTPVGLGEADLIDTDNTEVAHQRNRRVELRKQT